MDDSQVREYRTDSIVVSFDPALCIHLAECLRGAPEVFNTLRRPWVQPEAASPDALAEAVRRCPSGALQYERLDGKSGEPAPPGLEVTVVPSGPLLVRGDVAVVAADGTELRTATRLALCRCGQSQNKPYCDNTHMSLRD